MTVASDRLGGDGGAIALIGESKPMRELKGLIHRVAQTKASILITGESGTGKELVARLIHESGPLRGEPFVPVNCGAIPENLIETEMFGHHKGSFTGAINDKQGLFDIANGGTLFLDEVGELSLSMQVKLLRVLQEKKIRKVGGVSDVSVDVRIIAATNLDLEVAVRDGKFREDLYYRLNVILIRTPPLRDRGGDIRILAELFLKKSMKRAHKNLLEITPKAFEALEAYTWPGNVRELENVIERAVTLSAESVLDVSALPAVISSRQNKNQGVTSSDSPNVSPKLPSVNFDQNAIHLDQVLSDVERVYLLAALKSAGGSQSKAAKMLGITLRSLRYRLLKQKI
ncbi:MAG: sigma-54-dependent Fis family transcriptional regulator [Bdellovibrio sp.]|nr:sigma-54-dependent Fis family transcriptional regulator [Bdellovibrio sp.]